MHLIITLDTSLSMFRRQVGSNQQKHYVDVAVEGISQFIEYTSDQSHTSIVEIAMCVFSRTFQITSKFSIKEEDQLELLESLKSTIAEQGPGGRCQLVDNVKAIEKQAKAGLGDDSFLDIFLITDKHIDETMQTELLEGLDDQTRVFVFSFADDVPKGCGKNIKMEQSVPRKTPELKASSKGPHVVPGELEAQDIQGKIYIEYVRQNNAGGLTMGEDLGEKFIYRYSQHIAELIVSVTLGQLQDTCTMFPQPRRLQVKQNGCFEIVGFISLKSLMGLSVISRHVLLPRGRKKDEPHILQLMFQAQRDSVAIAKYDDQFAFITAMNYKTTCTVGTAKDLHMCLLLVDSVPWLGPLENLTPNLQLMETTRSTKICRSENHTSGASLFPIPAGRGAFGDNHEKSYACPPASQVWRSEGQITTDFNKLNKLIRKIPDDSRNAAFQRDFNRFTRLCHVFNLQTELFPKLWTQIEEVHHTREQEMEELLVVIQSTAISQEHEELMQQLDPGTKYQILAQALGDVPADEQGRFRAKFDEHATWLAVRQLLKAKLAETKMSEDLDFKSVLKNVG